ncbi:hypothetical protein CMO92_01105 [Candidatus Woesearchaeota archaeon]|nr:hypothetical protein [Candidatus Woesearchaeota archaeon]|tara:strand:+ start:1932 stop:2696 length:765 start_codon:yes stop_codon:yes gene_type:complete
MRLNSSTVEMSPRDLGRKITLPKKLTEQLSELIGIILGDGHLGLYPGITKKGHRFVRSNIVVSGHSKEIKYLKYVMELFKKLFNLEMVHRKDHGENAVILKAHSKGILQFLNKVCEVPINDKSGIITIPSIIKKSTSKNKFSFLRGLCDTDFSICFKKKTKKGHTYPVIKAAFKSKKLVEDLEKLYSELGFKYCVLYNERRYDKRYRECKYINTIYLNGKNNLLKWIDRVGFSNSKFKKKVGKWQKEGFCPPGY